MQGNSGPVNPGSITRQMGGNSGFRMPGNITGEAMNGYGAPGPGPGAPSTDNSGYYSTGNPFAVAPVERDDESDPRRQRYLNDRMGSESRYGGPGMAARLMTA